MASLPDPSEQTVTTELEELPVISLSRLIALKLACGLGNVRRTYRDFADVIELIAANQLGRDFEVTCRSRCARSFVNWSCKRVAEMSAKLLQTPTRHGSGPRGRPACTSASGCGIVEAAGD